MSRRSLADAVARAVLACAAGRLTGAATCAIIMVGAATARAAEPNPAPAPPLSASLPAASAADPRVGDVADPVFPHEKLQRALDGTFDWPPTPKRFEVNWTPDETGFAADRLYSVPAAGIHPRILFGPDDLPRLRANLKSNEAGAGMMTAVRALLDKGLRNETTWEGQCFTALVKGDLDAFKAAYKESPDDNNPPGSGFRSNVPGRNPAARWGVRNPLLAAMEAQAFIALLDDDGAAGKKVAAALATYASFVSPRVDQANKGPFAEFQWRSTRDLVGVEIAYGYDWAWKWMTPAQRDQLRSLIVRAVVNKYTVGMDLPPHWRNWNHLGITESYPACLFAIEGEEGFDPRGLDRIYEVYRDYLTYGIDRLGSGTEGVGYQTAGFGHIAASMIAFANRGKNLFFHPHYRRQTESWLVQVMQPFGGAWVTNGDLGNFPPNVGLLMVQKWFYPASPGIDFVYRNHPLAAAKDWARIGTDFWEAQWVAPGMPGETDTRTAAQQAAAATVDAGGEGAGGGGMTFHDVERGTLYTRTGWGVNDLMLHVDCRVDTTFANHDHPDRGQFTLSSHGRSWACDGYRDTESKFHNVVTIDGRGQGYFATPGKWLEASDSPEAMKAVIDAKYCWDWMWMKSSFTESKTSLERRGQAVFIEPAARLQERYPVDKWQADPTVAEYYEGFADRRHGDPRMWDDEDGWVIRTSWFPVQKAYRTVLLQKGAHPYVLVIDDIKKDDTERLYEWRMNMPPDVETVSIAGGDILLGDQTTKRGKPDITYAFQGKPGLTPQKGDRLLLVRTLDIAGPDLPTFQPIPMVATVEYKKTDDSHQFTGRSLGMGTQVVIGSRSTEPRFVIMLYPHASGDEMPKTTWNTDKTQLTIAWKDARDVYDVTTTAEGRRVFTRRP